MLTEQNKALIDTLEARMAISPQLAKGLRELWWRQAGQLLDAARAQGAASSETAIDQLIGERDEAEESLSQAYYLITGRSPEWSNMFGHKEALEEIDEAQTILRKAVAGAASAVPAGWLIEGDMPDSSPGWMTLNPAEALWGIVLTKESDLALRFSRREDAEAYFGTHIDEGPYRITQHDWRLKAERTPPPPVQDQGTG